MDSTDITAEDSTSHQKRTAHHRSGKLEPGITRGGGGNGMYSVYKILKKRFMFRAWPSARGMGAGLVIINY